MMCLSGTNNCQFGLLNFTESLLLTAFVSLSFSLFHRLHDLFSCFSHRRPDEAQCTCDQGLRTKHQVLLLPLHAVLHLVA